MKKIFFMMIAFLSMAVTASAQKGEDMARFHMGIRAGMTVNSCTGSDNMTALVFPYGGFALDFKIAPIPLYLETGAYYMNKGTKYDKIETHYYNNSHNYSSYSYSTVKSVSYDAHTFLVPLVASYHIPVMAKDKMSIQPFIGGFSSISFDPMVIGYGVRVGCGWNFGRLYANLGYDLGFGSEVEGNDFKDLDTTTHTFFMTVGFNWAGAK